MVILVTQINDYPPIYETFDYDKDTVENINYIDELYDISNNLYKLLCSKNQQLTELDKDDLAKQMKIVDSEIEKRKNKLIEFSRTYKY